jgi:hypothetical protein
MGHMEDWFGMKHDLAQWMEGLKNQEEQWKDTANEEVECFMSSIAELEQQIEDVEKDHMSKFFNPIAELLTRQAFPGSPGYNAIKNPAINRTGVHLADPRLLVTMFKGEITKGDDGKESIGGHRKENLEKKETRDRMINAVNLLKEVEGLKTEESLMMDVAATLLKDPQLIEKIIRYKKSDN